MSCESRALLPRKVGTFAQKKMGAFAGTLLRRLQRAETPLFFSKVIPNNKNYCKKYVKNLKKRYKHRKSVYISTDYKKKKKLIRERHEAFFCPIRCLLFFLSGVKITA